MTALIIAASVIAVITVLLLLPITICFTAKDGNFCSEVTFAGIIRLYPKRQKQSAPQKKTQKPGTQQSNVNAFFETAQRLGFSFSEWMDVAKTAIKALGRLARKLKAPTLKFRCLISAADPYESVMRYNYASTALYTLMPFAKRHLGIKDSDVSVGTDFDSDKTTIELYAKLYLRIGTLLLAPIDVLSTFVRIYLRHKIDRIKERKALKWKTNSVS